MSRKLGAYTVGIRLKEARERAELSRQALGRAAGVGATTIQHIESGEVQPRNDTIESLAIALHVHPCWLSYGTGERDVKPDKAKT